MTFDPPTSNVFSNYSFTKIQKFAFYGAAGNDTMTVDNSDALTTIPIFFDGDNGFQFSGDVTQDFIIFQTNSPGNGSGSGGQWFRSTNSHWRQRERSGHSNRSVGAWCKFWFRREYRFDSEYDADRVLSESRADF